MQAKSQMSVGDVMMKCGFFFFHWIFAKEVIDNNLINILALNRPIIAFHCLKVH